MKQAQILVTLETDRYVVARPEGDGIVRIREIPRSGEDAEAAAREALAQTIAELDGNGRRICLGLPGEMVLAAAVDLTNLPRRRRHAAMLYRLEEHLPLDIEALTAVFLPPAGGQALALAVQTEQLLTLLDGLRQAGIEVDAICPTALLAFQEATRHDLPPADHVIIPWARGTDILRLVDGAPVAWFTAPREAAEWRRCLEADLLAHPLQTPRAPVVLGPMPLDVGADESGASPPLTPVSKEPAIAMAARGAAAVLSGKATPLADFRRGALAADGSWMGTGGLVKAAAGLALLFLATLAAAFYVEGVRYGQVTSDYESRQVAEYQRLLPYSPVPPSIPSRLKSEASRLAALSGATGEAPEPPNALDALRRIATGLPAGVRLKITQLQIRPSDLSIEGEAPAHTDAEALTQALSRTGLAVEAPRTESRASGGVSFTITGKPAGK